MSRPQGLLGSVRVVLPCGLRLRVLALLLGLLVRPIAKERAAGSFAAHSRCLRAAPAPSAKVLSVKT